MNKIPRDCMELDFDGVMVRLTPEQFYVLDPYRKRFKQFQNDNDKLNKMIMMFMDLLKEGHFEDSLEETKKDGEAKKNRYNDGLYDVLNMIEDWWKLYYTNCVKETFKLSNEPLKHLDSTLEQLEESHNKISILRAKDIPMKKGK